MNAALRLRALRHDSAVATGPAGPGSAIAGDNATGVALGVLPAAATEVVDVDDVPVTATANQVKSDGVVNVLVTGTTAGAIMTSLTFTVVLLRDATVLATIVEQPISTPVPIGTAITLQLTIPVVNFEAPAAGIYDYSLTVAVAANAGVTGLSATVPYASLVETLGTTP